MGAAKEDTREVEVKVGGGKMRDRVFDEGVREGVEYTSSVEEAELSGSVTEKLVEDGNDGTDCEGKGEVVASVCKDAAKREGDIMADENGTDGMAVLEALEGKDGRDDRHGDAALALWG